MYKQTTKSSKDDWETPDWLFKQLDDRFNFTVDAAATDINCKVIDDYGQKKYSFHGLKTTWEYERVFCNPPFSEKDMWIKKAHDEVINGECPLCIMILPACIETKVFHKYINNKFHWEPLQGRVSFINPETKKPQQGNTTGTIIVYFWKRIVKDTK